MRAEEIVLSVPDGRSIKTLVNATPIHSADGGVESVVVTMQDLAPLEELERLRAEFLGMVSHELRAPLISIKGSAATALDASPALDPAEIAQIFRIINEQADHMRALISNLLDAGRIDAGTLSVDPKPSDPGRIGGSGQEHVPERWRKAHPPDRPAAGPAPGDGRRAAHRAGSEQPVLQRLQALSRVVPHPGGGVAGRRGRYDFGHGPKARACRPTCCRTCSPKHTGVGAGDRERGIGGSGLGLAICKGLVEAHGGRIRAVSGGAGQGTQVSFTIPVAEEAGDGAAAGSTRSRSRSPRKGREKTRILVVDDDPQTLRYVRDALATAGYFPLVTGDHRELSRLVRTEKPALVLLDLMLPGTDGIELMERVPEMADLPVIFISGYGRDETIARALEIGAADYIVKPFSPTELTARIQAALRRRTGTEPFFLEDLAIHYDQRLVTVGDRPVKLTATEYELLRVLSANAGRVSTYDSLLRQVWGERDTGSPELVRSHMKKLRRKLGDDATKPTYIFNERAIGYRMPKPNEQ